MKVLVATASRHGATREIGEQLGVDIATCLTERGITVDVDVRDVDEVDGLSAYDALVLGSAVYMGRWLKSARRMVDREAEVLGSIPVWLFSSGPIVTDDKPEPESKWATAPWALDHYTFGGRLDRSTLNIPERLVASAVHAADGDNRSPDEIRAWARKISDSLAATFAREPERNN
jgi:menaquinone-dependent protoporphyrinogen oxidase